MSTYIWLSLEGAIAYLGGDIHPQTLRRWVREGKLRAARPTPRHIRFRSDWLDAFMERDTDAPAVAQSSPTPARKGRIVSITDGRR